MKMMVKMMMTMTMMMIILCNKGKHRFPFPKTIDPKEDSQTSPETHAAYAFTW